MYCPKCGAETLMSEQSRKYSCSECDFLFFQNVAAATMAVVTQFNEGKLWLLVATRAKDPGKGLYDLPGGFVDPDESAEQALERELLEEIGVKRLLIAI
ncbi:molybdopterin-guanine dinucleotide biosynthesis protein mobB [Vibrio ishigakensis]|uniref:Molybdopterin-guanine dinucleotide biosynthesis protein mobB n=1 Tax=Vibrio ishigakensis TaxID=1481914 RepID=A0A0B8Q9E9_9VIBR|nr:molybdopterin-guanine dinucleotide biosynthesis protein mobB [Vibrio ishigakensis]